MTLRQKRLFGIFALAIGLLAMAYFYYLLELYELLTGMLAFAGRTNQVSPFMIYLGLTGSVFLALTGIGLLVSVRRSPSR